MLVGIIVALVVATLLYNIAFVISDKRKPIKPTKFDSKVEMNRSGDYFQKYYEEHNIGRPTMVELPKEVEQKVDDIAPVETKAKRSFDENITEEMYEVEILSKNDANVYNSNNFEGEVLKHQLKKLSPQMVAVIFGNILNKKY